MKELEYPFDLYLIHSSKFFDEISIYAYGKVELPREVPKNSHSTEKPEFEETSFSFCKAELTQKMSAPHVEHEFRIRCGNRKIIRDDTLFLPYFSKIHIDGLIDLDIRPRTKELTYRKETTFTKSLYCEMIWCINCLSSLDKMRKKGTFKTIGKKTWGSNENATKYSRRCFQNLSNTKNTNNFGQNPNSWMWFPRKLFWKTGEVC
ncbi:MAG: hypothetical protein QXQ46_04440 [Thermoplasmatales archaeon]